MKLVKKTKIRCEDPKENITVITFYEEGDIYGKQFALPEHVLVHLYFQIKNMLKNYSEVR